MLILPFVIILYMLFFLCIIFLLFHLLDWLSPKLGLFTKLFLAAAPPVYYSDLAWPLFIEKLLDNPMAVMIVLTAILSMMTKFFLEA